MSFDEERGRDDLLETAEWTSARDTIRDAEPTDDVRALMERIARGETVERTELATQLERMLALVTRTDADFEAIAILVRRNAPLRADCDAVMIRVLGDGSVIIHTPWPVSSRSAVAEQLAPAKPNWLDQHDDPRGVPSFRASQIDVVRHARSYEDALYLLGDATVFLRG